MNIALLVARVGLSVVFLVAAVTKLADARGSRQALRDFGVPAWLATPGGLLLPLAELAVAIALLPLSSAWWAAIGALALLLLFVIGIAFNLARGRRPNCHCFGQVYSRPIGWPTLLRNVVLAAVAGFVVGFGRNHAGLSALNWFWALPLPQRIELIGGLVVLALLVGFGWLMFQMLRQQGRLLLRIEELEKRLAAVSAGAPPPARQAAPPPGLPVGTQAPAFSLPGLYGETITLDFLRAANRPILLLFSDPACGPCNALMPEVGRWQREYVSKLNLAVLSRSTPEANRAKASEHGITQVMLQKDREVAEAYKCNGTPGAVLVNTEGKISSPLTQGAEAIRALVAQVVGLPVLRAVPAANGNGNGHLGNGHAGNGTASALQVIAARDVAVPAAPPAGKPQKGALAPTFTLPDLSGRQVNLSNFRGSRTLLLFWNPGCGFCQRMLDDLKAWEANPPASAPKLLVVSTGSVEANRALGLRATVLLDENMSVGSKFGANGTPMAVLIDAEGKMASEVVAGAPAVLALAGAQVEAAGNGAEPSLAVTAKVGDPAPAFSLPNLNGKRVNLSDFRGSRTLLLFWNPGCGFCQRMLADLKAWEARPPAGAPKVLVVSTGSVEANRALGLRSTIVLDQNMSVGSKFGAHGTPMAVLIDAQGKIASELAAGAPAVLALAGAGTELSTISSFS